MTSLKEIKKMTSDFRNKENYDINETKIFDLVQRILEKMVEKAENNEMSYEYNADAMFETFKDLERVVSIFRDLNFNVQHNGTSINISWDIPNDTSYKLTDSEKQFCDELPNRENFIYYIPQASERYKDRLIQRIESEILKKAKEGQYQHTLQVDIENSYPFQPKRMLCYEVVNQFQDNGFYVKSYTGQNVINILNITIVWG